MRVAPTNYLQTLWDAGTGLFLGPDAPDTRVTVEIGWTIGHSGAVHHPNGPGGIEIDGQLRWFQRADNSQVETEVPNIKSVEIDRSIDTDAATCKITLYNQKMLPIGTPPISGTSGESVEQPGYFTFNRGESSKAQSMWGWATNEWEDVLVPNALIRTYQGYGSRDKTILQGLGDGNLLLTGTWLVDSVKLSTNGQLEVDCRDMMKLAIDQEIYPPLIPTFGDPSYPLYFYRFVDHTQEPIPYGTTVYQEGWTPIDAALTNPVSTSDLEGSSIDGHTKADATDGDDSETYWLSGGHLDYRNASDLEWIQWNTPAHPTFNGFSFYPFMGTYVVYVSVMVGGAWQGTNTIPYSGTQFTGGFDPRIHYTDILKFHYEFPQILYLSQTYTAVEKIRLTFTNLSKTVVGPKFYRAGLRQIDIGNSTRSVSGGTKRIVAIDRASDSEDAGYWITGNDGGVFTYGPNLRFFGSEGSAAINQSVTGAFADGHAGGYMLVGGDGGTFAFGDVPYKGSLPGSNIIRSDIVDIERGCGPPSYKGYWILAGDGSVFSFGNATYHGGATPAGIAIAMSRDYSGNGYWIVDHLGHVYSFGTANYHGGSPALTSPETIVDIESTSTGNGYWLVGSKGSVFAYGDAQYHGGTNNVILNADIAGMTRTFDDSGYWLVGQDGGVFSFPSTTRFWGSLPEAFSFSTAGNYTDYSDIVEDLLLWSGWWFFNPSQGDSSPAEVFGNIETTGIYSPDNLTEDFFDKQPVVDIINKLKEIVGYIVYTDETGAFHFESPNIWSVGNFLETGVPTAYMVTLDETKQIVEYDVNVDYSDARSTITIASADPLAKFPDTITTTYTSSWGSEALRGIVRPALWVNGTFIDKNVQSNMAQLIDLHLFMASRQGQVTIPANPLIQINDQVRIYERTTSDTYIHYVRGYTSTHDLETGQYQMNIQTHWMGDGNDFFLIYDS